MAESKLNLKPLSKSKSDSYIKYNSELPKFQNIYADIFGDEGLANLPQNISRNISELNKNNLQKQQYLSELKAKNYILDKMKFDNDYDDNIEDITNKINIYLPKSLGIVGSRNLLIPNILFNGICINKSNQYLIWYKIMEKLIRIYPNITGSYEYIAEQNTEQDRLVLSNLLFSNF